MTVNESKSAPHNPIALLTAREAAGYLRVSLSTLYRMEQHGLLVPLRTPGGHRRYTVPMLNSCLVSAPDGNQPLVDIN